MKDIPITNNFDLTFDDRGFIPVIVTESHTQEVLMFAFMNEQSLAQSLEKKEAVFYSRSRQELWHKGATSGNILKIISIKTDCDRDCLLMAVEVLGDGVACHTGAKSCFFNTIF